MSDEAEAAPAPQEGLEEEMSDSRLHCRFYENQYPEVDDLVMVNVRSIAAMGAYVSLLEYNNVEGMILLSELSRRRIRSINKLIRVGKNEVVMVLRVDKEKGYIDLSKRRVLREDIVACEDKFNKAKAVHGVLRHVAETKDVPLERLYRELAWPLYARFGHAYDAFKMSIQEPERVFEGTTLEPELLDMTQQQIRRRLTPQPMKIRGDVEVTCFNYEGINAIREALMAAEALSNEAMAVSVKLIAPPMYVVTTSTLERDEGVELLNRAIAAAQEVIAAKGGSLRVKMAPKAVSQREETELNAMMERLELENREVDGDAAEDEA